MLVLLLVVPSTSFLHLSLCSPRDRSPCRRVLQAPLPLASGWVHQQEAQCGSGRQGDRVLGVFLPCFPLSTSTSRLPV